MELNLNDFKIDHNEIAQTIQYMIDHKTMLITLIIFSVLALIFMMLFMIIISYDTDDGHKRNYGKDHVGYMHYLYDDLRQLGYSHKEATQRVTFAGHYCNAKKKRVKLPQRVVNYVKSQDFNPRNYFGRLNYYE